MASKMYSWKDSNLADFGSAKDREVKKGSAAEEPEWKNVLSIDSDTLKVWRIRNFKLEQVKPDDHGKFFSGDSYIVLRVIKSGNELVYNAHFWIGKQSTQDEYGTAAYKVVELDTLLDDKAIQHREVDGFESDEFKACFPQFETLEGGYESGFNHVEPEKFTPRLLVFHGDKKNVELREVPLSRKSLDSGDVFILDFGTTCYQWNGSRSSVQEKYKAAQFLQELENKRNGRCKTEVIDELEKSTQAIVDELLPNNEIPTKVVQEVGKKAIYKVSDNSGKMETTLVCEGKLPRSVLTSDDVFLIDTGSALFVNIGSNCSRREKQDALTHAHNYLVTTNHPYAPVTVISNNRKSEELEKVLE